MNLPSKTARWVGCLFPFLLACLGADGPEVMKIWVPSAKVSSWFPPGSDLQVLPAERFEELLKAVRDRPAPRVGGRALSVRHKARWESGMLVGRSELRIAPPAEPGASLIVLEPWSLSLDGQGEGAKGLRATADGRLGVKVDSTGPTRIEPDWKLRARPGSDGRTFALALPDLDVSSLVLDLPTGLVPDANAGPRIGPEPGSLPGRSTWRLEAARGRIDLRLRNPIEDENRAGGPGLWLEGSTRIDFNSTPTNWRADWTLDESPGSPRQLTIELDPGLEVVEATGPRVSSFRVEAAGKGNRLVITLKGEGSGPSSLTIQAICPVPAEGVWAVASARPLDATWTGGRTIVRLDESRVLQSCQEKAGRRVAPRAAEPLDLPTLIFEPNGGAGPVAELTFRKPMADATVDVRGLLRLGDQIPRIEVALTWTVERGQMLSRAADLPPGWTPDRILTETGQPIAWHADPLSNGGTRVQISPLSTDDDARSMTLTLFASARDAGVTGPLDLPRVRPAPGPRVADEIWAATPEPHLGLRPILARGLAWIDPPDPSLDDIPAPWVADDLRNALAWRWLVDDAEARIDRAPPPDHPRGEVKLDASIKSGRVKLEWNLTVDSSQGDLRSVPIHLDQPLETPIRWRSREVGGPTVEARPIAGARRVALGFPETGSAIDLDLSGPSRGRIQLEGLYDGPWNGSGRLPLLVLPDRFRTRGLVAVSVEDSTRVEFDWSGLTAIDQSGGTRDSSGQEENSTSSSTLRTRQAAMFSYRSPGGRLRATTTRSKIDPRGGLIREAFLVSQVFPAAGIRHRLTLQVAVDTARSIELKMPGGALIDRVRRDGQPLVATADPGGPFRVEIPDPTPGRSTSTLTIDYRTDGDPRTAGLNPSRFLPDCSLACFSFVWELVTPVPWIVSGVTSGLVETDFHPTRSLVSKILGFQSFPWTRSDRSSSANVRDGMMQELDKAASETGNSDTNLGDWLLKLDAGRWPIVIDRLALRSAGWGPSSRINPATPESKQLGAVKAILQPMGLSAFPLDGMVLVTVRSEVPDQPIDRTVWSTHLREVPSQGSDATDRFQSASRWRGEATPRALSAGESPDRSPGSGGWDASRLVAAGWPPPGASVTLIDSRSDRVWGWAMSLAVLIAGIFSRNRSARLRAIGLTTIAALASLGLGWTWAEPSTTCTGLARGVLAVLAFWFGRALRPPVVALSVNPSEMSTTSRRSGFITGMGSVSMALALLCLGSMSRSAGLESDAPILVLLPFDGPPDPAAKPDRVVLLLDDFERLGRLARPEAPARSNMALLRAASHRVGREGPGLALVESLYEVEVDGDGPASWSLPVGIAIDLSATVDERPTPLVISADGLAATVAIHGSGTHQVLFRRLVPLSTIGRGGERAMLPILDKYAADADFREILRFDGPAVIPPIARADSAPEALALLKSKPRWSWSEGLAHSVLTLSGDSGQAAIRLIKDDGLSRVAELDKTDVEFQQFLPLYDLLHLANVARRGHSPTTGEISWAVIDAGS